MLRTLTLLPPTLYDFYRNEHNAIDLSRTRINMDGSCDVFFKADQDHNPDAYDHWTKGTEWTYIVKFL